MVSFVKAKLGHRLPHRRLLVSHQGGLELLAASLTLVLTGCSGAEPTTPGSFGETPAAVQLSEQRQFEIALYSSPTEIPVRGENHVRLKLMHASGADFVVNPSLVTFMPAMGHGSGVAPELTLVEGEYYTFENVVLNMPGRWELRLELDSESRDGAAIEDHAVFEFDVD